MTLALRLGRGETPGWIYSPATPGFFFTGGYCCKLATAKFTVMGGVRQGAIPIANAEQFFEETWSVLTPVPSPARSQAAGATYRGAGLHIGGTFPSPPYFSSQVDRLWQGTWNVETNLPAPRYAHAAASVGDAVYVVGGRDEQQQTVDSLFEYRDGTWTTKTPQPGGGRAFGNAVRFGGGFVSVGGIINEGTISSESREYSVVTNSWAQQAHHVHSARFSAAGFSIEGLTFVVGGNAGFGQLLQETLVLEHNTWRSGPQLPTIARHKCAGMASEAAGLVCGGVSASHVPIANNESLTNWTWTIRTQMLAPPRSEHVGAFQ